MSLAAATRRSAEVRSRRAVLKREVANGEVNVPELLRQVTLSDWLEGMQVEKLLAAIRRVSRAKVERLCVKLFLPPFKELGRMTYRKRCELADAVAEWERPEPKLSSRRARPRTVNTRYAERPARAPGESRGAS